MIESDFIGIVLVRSGELRGDFRVARILKELLESVGYFVRPIKTLPRGIDWLRDVQRILAPQIPKYIIDAGANVGETTKLFKRRFPSATVHAFEPVRETYVSLIHAVRNIEGVTCHQVALADQVGCHTFRVVPGHLANSLKSLRVSKSEDARDQEVDLITLDHFLAQDPIEHIDILKIDTEGTEVEVLAGATNAFAAKRISAVYVEVTFDPSDDQHTNFFDVFRFLGNVGFSFVGLYEVASLQIRNPFGEAYCNALFVLKNRVPVFNGATK